MEKSLAPGKIGRKITTKDMIMCALFTALIAVGAFIKVPVPVVQKNLTMGRLLAANFTGLAIVYACGMIYYYIICNFVIGTPIAFWPLFLYCFLLAVPGDICLCFVGAFLAKRLRPAYQRIQS